MRYHEFMDIMDLLRRFFGDRADVEVAYFFGSRARGEASLASDTDVAVLFNESSGDPAELSAHLMETIARETGQNPGVDVVDLDRTSPVLAHRVVREGRLILSRCESRRVGFEVAALRRYVDTAPLRRIFHEAQSRRIAERRFGHPA